MFLGTVINNLDAKGRVSVPADFRASVGDGNFDGIVLWPNRKRGCLEGGGMALIESYQNMLDAMDPFDPAREVLENGFFAGAKRLSFDTNGRVTLPKEFTDVAGLTDKAVFRGLGRRFEIWSPDGNAKRTQEIQDEIPEARLKMKTVRSGDAS